MLGTMIAHSIAQSGPGLPILPMSVYKYLLCGSVSDVMPYVSVDDMGDATKIDLARRVKIKPIMIYSEHLHLFGVMFFVKDMYCSTRCFDHNLCTLFIQNKVFFCFSRYRKSLCISRVFETTNRAKLYRVQINMKITKNTRCCA